MPFYHSLSTLSSITTQHSSQQWRPVKPLLHSFSTISSITNHSPLTTAVLTKYAIRVSPVFSLINHQSLTTHHSSGDQLCLISIPFPLSHQPQPLTTHHSKGDHLCSSIIPSPLITNHSPLITVMVTSYGLISFLLHTLISNQSLTTRCSNGD